VLAKYFYSICLFLSFGWEGEIEWQPRDATFVRDLTSYVLEWIDAGARWIGKFYKSTQCGVVTPRRGETSILKEQRC